MGGNRRGDLYGRPGEKLPIRNSEQWGKQKSPVWCASEASEELKIFGAIAKDFPAIFHPEHPGRFFFTKLSFPKI